MSLIKGLSPKWRITPWVFNRFKPYLAKLISKVLPWKLKRPIFKFPFLKSFFEILKVPFFWVYFSRLKIWKKVLFGPHGSTLEINWAKYSSNRLKIQGVIRRFGEAYKLKKMVWILFFYSTSVGEVTFLTQSCKTAVTLAKLWQYWSYTLLGSLFLKCWCEMSLK